MIMHSESAAPWRRRVLAVMAAASMAVAGFAGSASPAHAAPPLPTGLTTSFLAANRLGPLESLTVDSNGAANSVTTSAAFPTATATDGIRFIATNGDGSGATIAWTNVKSFSAASYDPAKKVVRSGTSAQAFFANIIQPWADGKEIVVYVILAPGGTTGSFSNPGVDDPSNATSPYFSSTLVYSAATKAWSVKADATTPALTPTTTTVAASTVTDTTATVTATVAPAAATGTVTFTGAGASVTSAVSGGVATANLTGLTASTPYTVTATYSGDSAYATSSNSVTFSTIATPFVPSDTQKQSDVNVSIPTQTAALTPGPLKISTTPAAVTLNNANPRTAGQVWTATSTSPLSVDVSDERLTGASWTLTAKATPFAKTGGSTTIGADKLTAAPKIGTITGGSATAGASGTLDNTLQLASGSASTTAYGTATVTADLSLAVPADSGSTTYDGAYASKLTVILA